MAHGADSEVGRLRTVMLHRPGPELSRLTPRNNDRLLFDGIPWVERAQIEHDAFAGALRSRRVEVLYLTDLVRETLAVPEAREVAVSAALADPALGDDLRVLMRELLTDLDPVALTTALTAGLRQDEVSRMAGARIAGLVAALAAPDDFVIDPLPNLLFTRDSSAWIDDEVAVTSLAMPARRRETSLTEVIYRHHPRFVGTE